MRIFLARFLLPVLIVTGGVLAFGSTTSDPPDAQRAAKASVRLEAPARGSKSPRRPHAILLILDEFPSDSLLDRQGRIDPVRYPNFAALAGDGTWFKNAYSVYDSTTKAVPLILDGIRPRSFPTSAAAGRHASSASSAGSVRAAAPRSG
jgi:hypothetical protein